MRKEIEEMVVNLSNKEAAGRKVLPRQSNISKASKLPGATKQIPEEYGGSTQSKYERQKVRLRQKCPKKKRMIPQTKRDTGAFRIGQFAFIIQ